MEEYRDNPNVAYMVSGEAMCKKDMELTLQMTEGKATVSPIPLFSAFGKRIYRHSLCFLLSYAVSKNFPNGNLIIMHSLGDGYFYRLEEHAFTKEDAEKIKETMQDAIRRDLPFERRYLTEEEAIREFERLNEKHASELCETVGQGIVDAYSLGGYTAPSYEPLVPSTSVLSVWGLMEYHGGLLLRYPQSRDRMRIRPFVDNPKLYEIFQETVRNYRILGVETLGELNKRIQSGECSHMIELSEALINRQFVVTASRIKESGKIKAVFIAGPSSSGKTTSSLKLCSQLEILGYSPVKISLDDYYKDRGETPLDDEGKPDYEVPDALDIKAFLSQMKDLLDGKEVRLHQYDFKSGTHKASEKPTKMERNSILVIEGIHGLNPRFHEGLDKESIFTVYISALTTLNIDDVNRVSTTDTRILRRMVRDSRTRGTSAAETLSMWPSVERGEKNNIFPYQNSADMFINSALPYEISALMPYAYAQLCSVLPKDKDAYPIARRLLKIIEKVCPMPIGDIPKDSVLREFLGGSSYGAI